MLIEKVEALKTWLTNKLSPICDAEPSALAKYVCALVKKDKPEQDLRDICLDQLDVFLQQKTKPFVDELFETLKTKSYIPPSEEKALPLPVPARPKTENQPPVHGAPKDKEDSAKKKILEITSTTDEKDLKDPARLNKDSKEREALGETTNAYTRDSKDVSKDSREPRVSPREGKEPGAAPREGREPRGTSREGREPGAFSREGRDRDKEGDRRDSWRDERSKDGIRDARDIIRENRERLDTRDVRDRDTREVREPRDRDHRDRDFRLRRKSRSRSFSPRRRDFDDRARRRYDDRPRYSPDRRWNRRRSWSRSPRRNRSPIGMRPRSRSPRLRSRSPRIRSRSPRDRFRPFRSRTRSRSPRPRSPSRHGSGDGRIRTRSPSIGAHQPDSRGSTPVQDNDYSTLISSSTNELPAVTSTVGLRPVVEDQVENRLPGPPAREIRVSRPAGGRSQCVDFEEKGFCMLGDMCMYDHGTDAVVVEDVPIQNVQGGPPSGPPNCSAVFEPPDLRVPPPGHMGLRINLRQPPPVHVEPYLPENPGLRGLPQPAFLRGPPPNLHQPPPIVMNRPPLDAGFPMRTDIVLSHAPPQFDDDDLEPLVADKEPSRIVIPAKRPYSAIGGATSRNLGPPPPRMPHLNQHHQMFEVVQGGQPQFPTHINQQPKKSFDYSRLGGRGGKQGSRPPFKTGNLTLEVRKIPPELNNIAKLNEHFGKFGTMTNIQVRYKGDQGAALISFSNNGEATAAYRSPEPVFNNRFIKLFWHNPDKGAEGTTEGKEEDGKDARQVEMDTQSQPMHRSGGRVGDGIDHPSLMLPVRSSIPPAHKLQLDNTKNRQITTSTTDASATIDNDSSAEKGIIYTSSIGNLKKTVFNPGAVQATSPKGKGAAAQVTSPTTLVKPADFVSRIEAIKRAEEGKKLASIKQAEVDAKKQDLLAKQIQQQKLLIETLDKKKATMSEEEKAGLLKALRTISDAIDKVKYGTGAKKSPMSAFQAQGPAQFKFVSQEQSINKEILDLELEVMAKQSKGEDTTALRIKVQELANKATLSAAPYGRGRGWSRGGGGWMPRGRGRGGAVPVVGRTHLDKRPKTLEVRGFDLEEIEELKLHFQRFGELEKVELVEEVPSAFMTFSSRPSAEVAIAQGAKFKKKTLTIRWNEMMQRLPRTQSIQSSDLDDEDLSVTLGSIDEEVLRSISSSNTDITTPKGQPEEDPEDVPSTVVVQDQVDMDTQEVKNQVGTTTATPTHGGEAQGISAFEQSLNDELMGEHHFKTSYSDDEDEDDNITVTLSNTSPSTSWSYTTPSATVEAELEGEDDLDVLANSETVFDEKDGSSWA